MRVTSLLLRRLGAIVCTVLMMHTSWMAATASCETVRAHERSSSVNSTPTDATAPGHAHTAHHHTLDAPDRPAHDAPAHHAPAHHTPAHHAPAHNASTASCPMAMACTLTVLATELPTVSVSTVAMHTARPRYRASAPHSTRTAPEPPPPRG